jgi:signal transduction histidine kinase
LISNLLDAVTYWFRATLWPRDVILELKDHPHKVAVAVWTNAVFAALYAITALIYYAIGRLPAIPPCQYTEELEASNAELDAFAHTVAHDLKTPLTALIGYGPGLTSEAQAKLFTEFTRLEKVRATGHGLGLSIVLRIVTKLGGEVGVESEVGVGSRFWFELPK